MMLQRAPEKEADAFILGHRYAAWRLPGSNDELRANTTYCNIVRWFTDYPGPACIYSIHHLVQCGMLYDKLPGEWYGPSAAALVLRDLARLHRRKYRGPIEIYVTSGDTIYITDVEKTFTMTSVLSQQDDDDGDDNDYEHGKYDDEVDPNGTAASLHPREKPQRDTGRHLERRRLDLPCGSSPDEGSGREEDIAAPSSPPPLPPQVSLTPFGHDLARYSTVDGKSEEQKGEVNRVHDPFHDPLLNPPPVEAKDAWPGALFVLIPIRLGLDKISPHYFEELKAMLRHPHTVGIIGGKPNRALYFAGYRGDSLLGLDPHTVYSNPSLRDPFPSDEHMGQMHQELDELVFSQLDPSLALGFYFRNREEFLAFCNDITASNEQKVAAGITPLFSIQYSPPDTEFLKGDMFSGGSDDEDGERDPEDEYVFV